MLLYRVKFILLMSLSYLLAQIIIIATHIYNVLPVKGFEDFPCLAFTFRKSFIFYGMSELDWILGATAFAILLSINLVLLFAVFFVEHKKINQKKEFLFSFWIITFIFLWVIFTGFLLDKCVID